MWYGVSNCIITITSQVQLTTFQNKLLQAGMIHFAKFAQCSREYTRHLDYIPRPVVSLLLHHFIPRRKQSAVKPTTLYRGLELIANVHVIKQLFSVNECTNQNREVRIFKEGIHAIKQYRKTKAQRLCSHHKHGPDPPGASRELLLASKDEKTVTHYTADTIVA